MKHVYRLAFLGLATLAWTQSPQDPGVRLGTGDHVYEWVSGWGELPDDAVLGNTHGCIVTDSKGRVYVNTDTEHAVVVFGPDGDVVDRWGAELAGGLHGMDLVREGDDEFLYLTHLGRHEVLKATLAGEILWRKGYPKQAGIYADANEYRPTSIAVAPNGHFYVADGYGKSWIHHYDDKARYVRSIGGPGTEPGKFRTPHGIWYDESSGTPTLIVADRENNRLQVLDLAGNLLEVVAGDLRRPCHVHARSGDFVVPDLAGRVTILDSDFELVTHLGDNPDPAKRARNGVPLDQWKDGEFLSPHCARWDAQGNLFVMDWNARGRITKLARVE